MPELPERLLAYHMNIAGIAGTAFGPSYE